MWRRCSASGRLGAAPLLLALVCGGNAQDGDHESRCAAHGSREHCLAFRRHHNCVWDVPLSQCVPDPSCELRSQSGCTFELTTGDKSSSWDCTTNKCFWDGPAKSCRWSDTCWGATDKATCDLEGCTWQRRCTSPDDRYHRPGCFAFCAPPTASGSGLLCGSTPELKALLARTPPRLPRSRSLGERKAVAPPRVAAAPLPAFEQDCTTPTVQAPAGPICGMRQSTTDAYLGIPFAAAPVAELRWKPPQPLKRWNSMLAATSFGAGCAQPDDAVRADGCRGMQRGTRCTGKSDDCLSLNIYVPRPPAAAAADCDGRKGLAVMVWIHGGCYSYGSTADSEYNATKLAETQGVIVVTAQYRLGVLGFLGHDALRDVGAQGSTGNYGLLDNVAALQWVQDNVAAFGGDPGRVTIFGESSGAGSVSTLLGVERAWPLFQGAIMESGAAAAWTYMDMTAAYQNFNALAALVKCDQGTIESQIDCLMQVPSTTLASAEGTMQVPCRDGCRFAPVIDGVVVRARTVELARKGLLRPNTPVIMGFNLDDGAEFVLGSYNMNQAGLATYFSRRFGPNRAKGLSEVYPVFGGLGPEVSPSFLAAARCETDFSYACPAMFLADAVPAKAYVYEFSYRETSVFGSMVNHGDEVYYVFGDDSMIVTPEARNVSAAVMGYWGNFAKSGDPNSAGDACGASGRRPEWPLWRSGGATALLNFTGVPSVAPGPHAEACAFWWDHWDYYRVCLPTNPAFSSSAWLLDSLSEADAVGAGRSIVV